MVGNGWLRVVGDSRRDGNNVGAELARYDDFCQLVYRRSRALPFLTAAIPFGVGAFLFIWGVWTLLCASGGQAQATAERGRDLTLLGGAALGAPFLLWQVFVRHEQHLSTMFAAAVALIDDARVDGQTKVQRVGPAGFDVEETTTQFSPEIGKRAGAIERCEAPGVDFSETVAKSTSPSTLKFVLGSLSGARFDGRYLRKLTMWGVKAESATFVSAVIDEMMLAGEADLTEAVFDHASLGGAVKRDGGLEAVQFGDSQLARATFVAARLDGAKLDATRGLSSSQLAAAFGDDKTALLAHDEGTTLPFSRPDDRVRWLPAEATPQERAEHERLIAGLEYESA